MLSFQNLKLKHRILLGYAVPLLLTISATTVVIVSAKNLEEQVKAANLGWSIVRDSDRLEMAMYKRQADIRGYILTGDETFAKKYEKNLHYYQQNIALLEKIVRSSGADQMARLEQLKLLGNEISSISSRVIKLVKNKQVKEAQQEFARGKILSLVDEASQVLLVLNNTENKRQLTRNKAANEAMQSLLNAAIVGAVSAAILAILVGLWIAERITQKVNETIGVIASSSLEIAATTEQHERTANQQAISVNQTSSTMDELRASSRQAAEQAEGVTIGAKAIAQQVFRLSEQTKQIASINSLVSDIASQTNMLALNAAVEAVRAGEHGKGFAIVAAEIRKLADRSKNSADKINTLLADIQAITDATVVETIYGTKEENIVTAVNNIVINNQQISLSAKQQAIAIEQVVSAMNVLNEGAVETACGISQTKIGIQRLNEAALSLQAVV